MCFASKSKTSAPAPTASVTANPAANPTGEAAPAANPTQNRSKVLATTGGTDPLGQSQLGS